MEKTLLFLIAIVFCFATCNTLAKQVIEVDVSKSLTEGTNNSPVDTAVNKESYFNGSELEAALAGECKCKNGKCMRACDVDKTTPCDDQKKVCVCNPEFAETYVGECKYCDCGHGFNCTFNKNYYGNWQRDCFCPKGYYKDTYSSKCRVECSKERPCKNGGTCESDKRCRCGWAATGDLCEEIVWCETHCLNRLEVDCLYDQRHKIAYCNCKNSSLYYDEEAGICKPCPCDDGYCDYEFDFYDRKLKCNCHHGYVKFNGYCKKCDCGYGVDGQCKLDSKGEKICRCIDGFYEREGRCWACGCHGWSDMETKCEVTGNAKRCFCKEGYEDVLGHCEDINECETNNTCHSSATCYNTLGSFECTCSDGYKHGTVEPGDDCKDINECEETMNACWYWNVKCVNLPGSYKCECIQGYEPDNYFEEPHKTRCVQTTKNSGPVVIVVCTSLVLLALTCWVHIRVKKRATSS